MPPVWRSLLFWGVEMTDLLSCPFCGGEASDAGIIRYGEKGARDIGDGKQREYFYCNCIHCGVSNAGLTGHTSKDGAIAAWNTRATPQPTQPSDWIPHNGGPMPVGERARLDLESRDGDIETNVTAENWRVFFNWQRIGGDPDFDIIAYRLSEGEPS